MQCAYAQTCVATNSAPGVKTEVALTHTGRCIDALMKDPNAASDMTSAHHGKCSMREFASTGKEYMNAEVAKQTGSKMLERRKTEFYSSIPPSFSDSLLDLTPLAPIDEVRRSDTRSFLSSLSGGKPAARRHLMPSSAAAVMGIDSNTS